MSINSDLLKEAIADARRDMIARLDNTPTIHVVIGNTLAEAKAFKKDHRCSRCYDKVRHFTKNGVGLRGQSFNDVNYVHVLTDDAVVWRDIVLIISCSPKFSGPIWTYFQRK